MLSLESRSKHSPEVIIHQLKSYFGGDGLGLKLEHDCDNFLTFVGGGGYVSATLCTEGKQTVVGLETREWEVPVKKFAALEL